MPFSSAVDDPKRMRAWEVSCEALRDAGLASGFKLTSSVSGSTTRCWMCARWSRAEGVACVGLPDLPSSRANFSRETTNQPNLHCMRVSQPGKSKTPLILTRDTCRWAQNGANKAAVAWANTLRDSSASRGSSSDCEWTVTPGPL